LAKPLEYRFPILFSADGKSLILRVGTEMVLKDLEGADKLRWEVGWPTFPLKMSAMGQRLATMEAQGRLKVWDLRNGQILSELQTGLGTTAIVFHPGGVFIATAHDDCTIKVWNTQTREEWFTIRGHTNGVTGLAFRDDGNRLLSGSGDRSVKLWDTSAIQDR